MIGRNDKKFIVAYEEAEAKLDAALEKLSAKIAEKSQAKNVNEIAEAGEAIALLNTEIMGLEESFDLAAKALQKRVDNESKLIQLRTQKAGEVTATITAERAEFDAKLLAFKNRGVFDYSASRPIPAQLERDYAKQAEEKEANRLAAVKAAADAKAQKEQAAQVAKAKKEEDARIAKEAAEEAKRNPKPSYASKVGTSVYNGLATAGTTVGSAASTVGSALYVPVDYTVKGAKSVATYTSSFFATKNGASHANGAKNGHSKIADDVKSNESSPSHSPRA